MTGIDQNLLEDWKEVQRSAGSDWLLPDLDLVFVSHARVPCDPSAEADALAAANARRGWVRYQSASFEGSAWSGDDENRGRLLWAEWVDGIGDTSYRLTPDPAGSRALVRHVYRESRDPIDERKNAVLAENVALQGFNGQVLHYRVYWGATQHDSAALLRLFARLVRIEVPQK
jgi:hypothetical protein